MIQSAENPELAFEFFYENSEYIESSDQNEIVPYFTAQQLSKYKNKYDKLIDGILNNLIIQHYEKSDFYKELWKQIMKNDLQFPSDDDKIYALGCIWSDFRIPYFCVEDGLRMSNEDFSNIIEEKKEILQEIIFILNCDAEQKTETASLLLNVIEKCNDPKEKAVMMAVIIDYCERKVIRSIIEKGQ